MRMPIFLVFNFTHNRLNILYCNGVDPCERFVEQDKFGVGSQRPGNFSPTAFPARGVSMALAHAMQVEFINQQL